MRRFKWMVLPAAGLVACLAAAATAQEARPPLSSLGAMPMPAAAALAPRALQDLNLLLGAGQAYFDPAQGRPCPGGPDEVERAALGPRAYGELQQALAAIDLLHQRKSRIVRLVMLSGDCPAGGRLSGPVEFVLTTETVRGAEDLDIAQREDLRMTAVYAGGEPVGEMTAFKVTSTATYHVLAGGERIEMKTGNAEYDRNAREPVYAVSYTTLGRGGTLAGPAIGFSVSGAPPAVSVGITTQVDEHRTVLETYRNGSRQMRMSMKDGVAHGWYETGPPGSGQSRTCFQDGVIVKALECPET